MTIDSLIALVIAIVIFAASPGPAIFATVARTLASGFWPGVTFLLGCVAGDVVYLLLAVYGLSYVASSLGEIFVVARFVGAVYLVWLGVRLWRADPVVPDERAPGPASPSRGLGEGLLVTLASPKAIFFFGALLPTFLDVRALSGIDVVVVAAVVAVGITSVNLAYVIAAARARRMFRSRRAVRVLNRTAGSVMVGTGIALANR